MSVTNPFMTFKDDFFRFVPVAILHCTFQVGAMMSVQVLKYPILILQSSIARFLWQSIMHSREASTLAAAMVRSCREFWSSGGSIYGARNARNCVFKRHSPLDHLLVLVIQGQ